MLKVLPTFIARLALFDCLVAARPASQNGRQPSAQAGLRAKPAPPPRNVAELKGIASESDNRMVDSPDSESRLPG